MLKRILLLAVALAGTPAFADEPLLPFAADIEGPRALAMGGAQRASGLSNDAIYLNPAAIAAEKRYTLNLQGEHDFGIGYDTFGASVSDSTAGPVAGALAFNRVLIGPEGDRRVGNLFSLALAVPLSDFLVIGASGKFLHIAEFGKVHNVATPDVGLIVRASIVTLGFTAYNLIDVKSRELPRQYGFGANFTLISSLKLEGDLVVDTSTNDKATLSYHAGLQWEVIPLLAVRAGYLEDRILGQRAISGGIGIYIPPGFSIELAYKHELLGSTPGRLAALAVSAAF